MADLIPAATVILLRDTPEGLQTLMLRRGGGADFVAGAWVFPGGRVDPPDRDAANGDLLLSARFAAARETEEEAGLHLDPAALSLLSRWTAPEEAPKRHDTWFFLGHAPVAEVAVDGREIDDHLWTTPAQALEEQQAGRLQLVPPTWVTLIWLAEHASADEALAAANASEPPHFLPRVLVVGESLCFLYAGDAGYDSRDLEAPGARHRLWMNKGSFRYERD